MLEQLFVPSGMPAHKFAPIEIPPEVQARFDALSEGQKATLTLEMRQMFDALYAKMGVSSAS